MKKIVGFILGLLLVGSIASAQSFDLGVKGGYLYSSIKDKDLKGIKTEGNSGYLVGVFARLGGEVWFFQPELQYRVRSSDVVSASDAFKDILGKGNKVEVKLKTLDIPLQVGYTILDLPLFRLAAHAGPVVSFKLADDTTVKNEVKNFNVDKLTDYKSFIWSGQVGVSADISRFVIDLSYEKGFSDVSDGGLGKNDLFLATVGIKLF